MKRIVLIMLLMLPISFEVYAGDLVFKIDVPDTSILKQETIKLTAKTDSSHTYDMGEWVKKENHIKVVTERDSLQSKILQIVRLINPDLLNAYQVVFNPEIKIIKKIEYDSLVSKNKKANKNKKGVK